MKIIRKIILFCLLLSPVIGVAQTQNLNKEQFLKLIFNYEKNPDKWVFLGQKPCIIDFYAVWCGPCKRMAPIFETLSEKYKKDINVYKIDIGNEPELAAVFGVRSIPTILFCPMQETPKISEGALPQEDLERIIQEFLLKKTNIK